MIGDEQFVNILITCNIAEFKKVNKEATIKLIENDKGNNTVSDVIFGKYSLNKKCPFRSILK